MSVPIAVSPSRSGFGPQLNLSYDSGSGNGPFGFGWSLSVPSISRKTDKGLPQYHDSGEGDVFILSGAEDLVPVLVESGGQWVREGFPLRTIDGKTYRIQRYRPRIEGLFARIERWTNQANGEIYWRSITKDNITTIYGKDNNSRIFDPQDPNPTHPTRIFSWLICQSYDDKGSAISYEYKEENSDAVDNSQVHEKNRTSLDRSSNHYLKRIRYGNRRPNRNVNTWEATDPKLLTDWMFEVVFDYGEGHYTEQPPDAEARQYVTAVLDPLPDSTWPVRQDSFSSYRAGFEVRTYRICRRVLMFHHFPQELGIADCLVRSTEFTYAESSIASFIASATQSGYVRQPGQNQANRYLKKSLPPLEFEYSQVPSPEQLAQQPIQEVDAESLENLPYGLDGSKYQWMDLDGEGTSGILTEQGDGWYYKRNLSANHQVMDNGQERTVAQFGPLEVVASKPASGLSGGAQFLDLAGDGQVDLVQMQGPVRGFYERTTDDNWEPFQPFESWPNLNTRDPDLRFVDLTGDGHTDMLVTEDDVFVWYPSLAEEGFGPAERTCQYFDEEMGPRLVLNDGTESIYLADLSGDGLSDLVRIRNGEVCYWPNLGYGRFGARVTMDNAPWFDAPDQFDQTRIRLADIDGSGTTDILYLHREGVHIYFNQSGNRWSGAVALPQFPPIDNISSVQALDLLGNGTACLVWSSPLPGNTQRPMRYLALMEEKPHLLVGVKNNLGAETKVHYAPSTKFYLKDKQNGKPWITRLPFPVHVVERVETHDYISRNRFVTRYAYHHGYFDGPEREFRGFGMVEQWDTEEIGTLALGSVSADDTNWNAASFVPPVLTRTWFHTGAFIDEQRISKQFEYEYWREGDTSESLTGLTDQELRSLLLDDTVLPTTIRGANGTRSEYQLSEDEVREACRSLKGAVLRLEIYALDGTDAADRPYSVSERNYTIEMLQPQNVNNHAIFFTHAHEQIDFHYERRLLAVNGKKYADPRVSHAMTLEADAFGNALRTLAIGYRRRDLPGVDAPEQKQTHITLTVNRVVNQPAEPDWYHIGLPVETRTYELVKPPEPTISDTFVSLFVFDDMLELTMALFSFESNEPNVTNVWPYEKWDWRTNATNAPGQTRLRLIEHVRTLYRSKDLTGFLPLGTADMLALPGESYKLAVTPNPLKTVYVDTGKVSANDVNNVFGTYGGYVHSEGDSNWWIPSGRVFFDPSTNIAAQELITARQHFFLPRKFTDPFNQSAIMDYDANDLLVIKTQDAVNNTVTAQHDYRVLQPNQVTDPNHNRTEMVFDALGMVVATAMMGKPGENKGDVINSAFESDLTLATIQDFVKDSRGKAKGLLGSVTTRVVYDLDRYQRCGQPPFAVTLAREIHFNDSGGSNSPIQLSFLYSDGFGREIQTKVQAEAGNAPQRAANVSLATGDIKPGDLVRDLNGNITQASSTQRLVGTGRTVYNNKGKPVKKYEPFFSNTHLYEPETEMTDTGVTPILFYDPVERVIATLQPNHTYAKVVFDPWQQTTWDVNDTVLLIPQDDLDISGYVTKAIATIPEFKTWFDQRIPDRNNLPALSVRTPQQDAAMKAMSHAKTPTVAYFDTLGRTFLTVANNGKDANGNDQFYKTSILLDIEGNQREVLDAKDRVVMRYDYDMLGNRIYQNSVDGGERWMLNDILGKPVRAWDSRDHEFSYQYDELRRPTEMRVKGGDGQTPLDNVYEKIIYGENQALNTKTDTELNLRGKPFEHYDTGGKLQFEQYDFKGSLLKSNRRLTIDYKKTPHWDVANPDTLLENNSYVAETQYDALNRVTKSKTPDESVTTPMYNAANLLEKVDVVLQDGSLNHFVTDINYNEKGQRKEILYGNNIKTMYEYERETFRLIQLETRKANGELLQKLHYTFDPAGNITQIEDSARPTIFFKNLETTPVSEFTYDAIYRLIEAHGREHIAQVGFDARDNWHDLPFLKQYSVNDPMAWRIYTEYYQYDSVGNIEKMRHVAPGGDWTRNYNYETTNNRLKSTTIGDPLLYTYPYSYHPEHGFMIKMPHLDIMEWNFRDELQSTVQQERTDGGKPETTYYVYDSNGQRIRKLTENTSAPGAIPTTKSERIYIGGTELYKEYTGTNAGLERNTLHLMDDTRRIAMVETRKGTDDGSPTKLIRYQFSNRLGTACLEVDDTARVISYEEYHPYGTTSYQAVDKNIKASAKRYRYTGKERDEENGLNYHEARYYTPWLARWTSCDPAEMIDGPNLYIYSSNNPISAKDPDGLETCREDELDALLANTDHLAAEEKQLLPNGAIGRPQEEDLQEQEDDLKVPQDILLDRLSVGTTEPNWELNQSRGTGPGAEGLGWPGCVLCSSTKKQPSRAKSGRSEKLFFEGSIIPEVPNNSILGLENNTPVSLADQRWYGELEINRLNRTLAVGNQTLKKDVANFAPLGEEVYELVQGNWGGAAEEGAGTASTVIRRQATDFIKSKPPRGPIESIWPGFISTLKSGATFFYDLDKHGQNATRMQELLWKDYVLGRRLGDPDARYYTDFKGTYMDAQGKARGPALDRIGCRGTSCKSP